MAGGLSPNHLHKLLQEYGSYEAAIETRPDLPDGIRAAREPVNRSLASR